MSDFKKNLRFRIPVKRKKRIIKKRVKPIVDVYYPRDLEYRVDKKTGRICVFINTKTKEIGDETHVFLKRVSSDYEFSYVLYAANSRGCSKRFIDTKPEEEENYRRDYYYPHLFLRLYGYTFPFPKFTLDSLKLLESDINFRKDFAKYNSIGTIEYAENYEGPRLLEGHHIAGESVFLTDSTMTSLENVNYIITLKQSRKKKTKADLCVMDAEGNILETVPGDSFNIHRDGKFFDGLLAHDGGCHHLSFNGYTVEALSELMRKNQLEKKQEARAEEMKHEILDMLADCCK